MTLTNQYKKCTNCNNIITDMAANQCPKCSSNKLNIFVDIKETVHLYDSLKGKKKDPNFSSKRNPRVEFFTGADKWRDKNKMVQKLRVIDKTVIPYKYKEQLIDIETGEIIKDVEEPLVQHPGHGSAKFKKKHCD